MTLLESGHPNTKTRCLNGIRSVRKTLFSIGILMSAALRKGIRNTLKIFSFLNPSPLCEILDFDQHRTHFDFRPPLTSVIYSRIDAGITERYQISKAQNMKAQSQSSQVTSE